MAEQLRQQTLAFATRTASFEKMPPFTSMQLAVITLDWMLSSRHLRIPKLINCTSFARAKVGSVEAWNQTESCGPEPWPSGGDRLATFVHVANGSNHNRGGRTPQMITTLFLITGLPSLLANGPLS